VLIKFCELRLCLLLTGIIANLLCPFVCNCILLHRCACVLNVIVFQAVLSDADKKMTLNTETGLTVENSFGLVSLDNSDVQQADVLDSAHTSELRDTCIAGGATNAEPDAVPSAVLQPNGEFMCSSCGVAMKCARAIKSHLSVHTSLQSPEPSTTSCHKTADTDGTDVINKTKVKRNRPKRKRTSERKGLPKLDSTKDNSEQWRSYVCSHCGDTFTAVGILNSHRILMHRPFKCLKCGMVLTGRRNFSQHVRKEHPGEDICKVTVFTFFLWNCISY